MQAFLSLAVSSRLPAGLEASAGVGHPCNLASECCRGKECCKCEHPDRRVLMGLHYSFFAPCHIPTRPMDSKPAAEWGNLHSLINTGLVNVVTLVLHCRIKARTASCAPEREGNEDSDCDGRQLPDEKIGRSPVPIEDGHWYEPCLSGSGERR